MIPQMLEAFVAVVVVPYGAGRLNRAGFERMMAGEKFSDWETFNLWMLVLTLLVWPSVIGTLVGGIWMIVAQVVALLLMAWGIWADRVILALCKKS